MSIEIQFESLPSFDPLYQEMDTTKAIEKAEKMIQESSSSDQRILLSSDKFQNAVNTALFNKDQRRHFFAEKIINAFDEALQPDAQEIFGEV